MRTLEDKFIGELGKCTDPTIFIGVAKILHVDLLSDKKDEDGHRVPRPFDEIACDMVQFFELAPRKRKRELLKIFNKANIETRGDKANAARAEDSKEAIQD